jgi:hypothetical protein
VGLELGVELVLASLLLLVGEQASHCSSSSGSGCGAYGFVSLEEDYPATLVSCREIVSRVVKLDGGNDVGYEV